MDNIERRNWIFRSFLFIPGHLDKMLFKAASTNADSIALCLEDAVPHNEKENARKKIKSFLKKESFQNKTTFVRINSMDTGLTLKDLEAVSCEELDGFVYPMANTEDDIKSFDSQLSLIENQLKLKNGHFSVIVLIETPLAVLNAYKIAKASDRVIGLLFGCEDYMADMESRYSFEEQSLFVPRSLVAIAAKAAGVEAIDTPYVKIHDDNGLERFANLGRDLGMTGMLAMSPRQIKIINKCYTPTVSEVESANEVVEGARRAKKEGKGILIIKNNFISPPTVKQSKKILKRHNQIKAYLKGS